MAQSRAYKAGILGSSKVLIRVSGILTAAVLARLLTKVDYAAFRQTILAFHFVEPLLILGLSQALIYFIPRDRDHSRSILTGNLLMLFGMGCVFAAAMWLGGNELLASQFNNPALKRLLLIYSPYGMLALPLSTIASCLLACDRVRSLAVFEVVNRAVGVVLVIVFVLIWRTPTAAVAGILAGMAIMFFPGLKLMYRSVASGDWLPSRENMKEQLKFGVPLGLSALIGIISINLDKFLVSSFFAPEQFAVYVNGAMEVPLVGIITGSVVAVLIPEFAGGYKDKSYSEIIALWQRAMVKCGLILFPIMAFLMIFAPEVMTVVFSATYRESALPFRVYLCLMPIRITNFGALIIAAGKSSYILYKSLGSLLINLVLSLMLIRVLGYIGAAVGTVITLYVWNVTVNLYLISRLYQRRPLSLIPWSKLGTLALLSAIPAFLVWLLGRFGDLKYPLLIIAVFALIYFPVYLLLAAKWGYITIEELKSAAASIGRKIVGK